MTGALDKDLLAALLAKKIGPGEAMRQQCERAGDKAGARRFERAIAETAAWKKQLRDAGTEPLKSMPSRSIGPFLNATTPPPQGAPVGIHAIWLVEVPKIRASNGQVRQLLAAHESAIESRSDLTECQKNARRRMVLEYWYAEQSAGADETAKDAAPVVTVQDPRTGPGIPR